MFFSCVFLCLIPMGISLSNQEDLSILKYSQIGCLKFKSDKEFLLKNIQENFLLPYQTFSSSNMTIELCFRLCRRWIILMFDNQTKCLCLYTINRPYEFSEYLGEFLSTENCQSTNVRIYSLTKSMYLLPPLIPSTNDDWSLDGCYYLHGIQTIRADYSLVNFEYIQAIDLCRKHCKIFGKTDHYSYFLSRRKSCYCLPIDYSQTTQTAAVRKPLKHCSFLPYICSGMATSCEKYYSDVNLDTLIKIDVQQYCSSSNFVSFVFDRIFYLCLKSILLNQQMSFSMITYDQKCLPLIITTSEQWNYLIHSSWITTSKIFISIDRTSTFIFQELFQFRNSSLFLNDFCLVLSRTGINQVSYELIQCSAVRTPGYVLCAQKPIQSKVPYDEGFHIINNQSDLSIDETLSCPPEFILFNKICYYIHSSFIHNIQSSEQLCNNQYSNSTLVKFDSHEWGNINTTRFLGRTFEDILLEFFYYILERKLFTNSINDPYKKHFLRLLLGVRNNSTECVLRYFVRSSGAFTMLHQCFNGGHPVCQCEPIQRKIPAITSTNKMTPYITTSPMKIKTESTTTTSITTTTQIIILTSTNSLILPNETIVPICENCTTSTLISDEELFNNETDIDSGSSFNTSIKIPDNQKKSTYTKYRTLILILTGPVLALLILLIGIGFLIRYLRQSRGSYSTRSSIPDTRRTKRSSTTVTISDVPNTPAVLYTRLKPPRLSTTETDMLISLDNPIPIDDNVQLLPATKMQIINNQNQIIEDDDEEPFYAILK